MDVVLLDELNTATVVGNTEKVIVNPEPTGLPSVSDTNAVTMGKLPPITIFGSLMESAITAGWVVGVVPPDVPDAGSTSTFEHPMRPVHKNKQGMRIHITQMSNFCLLKRLLKERIPFPVFMIDPPFVLFSPCLPA